MNSQKYLFIIGVLFCCNVIANDELNQAISAYDQEDYQLAYKKFNQLAHQDNTEAQYNLAFMYFGGQGIPQNDVKAAYWFEQAAKSGHAGAQDTLAYMYLHGRGLGMDKVHAYAWYRVAAENGVFLAKNVSENLKKQMDHTDKIHADILSREYLKKYTHQ
jgi:TPR repeat protein